MGIYNEFYVFEKVQEEQDIPLVFYNIHNRAIGLFFKQNIKGFESYKRFPLTKVHLHNLLLRYENGTLARSVLTKIDEPLLLPNEVRQLREIKDYIDSGLKVVYRQIN